MSYLEQQAESNCWALARDLGLPGLVHRARKAGMSWRETEGVLVNSDGKDNPHQYGNRMISMWRAENV